MRFKKCFVIRKPHPGRFITGRESVQKYAQSFDFPIEIVRYLLNFSFLLLVSWVLKNTSTCVPGFL